MVFPFKVYSVCKAWYAITILTHLCEVMLKKTYTVCTTEKNNYINKANRAWRSSFSIFPVDQNCTKYNGYIMLIISYLTAGSPSGAGGEMEPVWAHVPEHSTLHPNAGWLWSLAGRGGRKEGLWLLSCHFGGAAWQISFFTSLKTETRLPFAPSETV